MQTTNHTNVSGESDGFSDWLVSLQADLRRRAAYLTGNQADAADLAQATSLRALEKRQMFARGSSAELNKWLGTIMANLLCDLRRKGSREVVVEGLEEIPASVASPKPVWATVADEEVDAAMQRLGPKLREPYRLFTVDRLSHATISTRLNIPVATVATRIWRARSYLRATLTCRELPSRRV